MQKIIGRPASRSALAGMLLSATLLFFVSPFASQSSEAATVYAKKVIASAQGAGVSNHNFLDPNSTLGAPNYSGGAKGTGAYSLGVGGSITLQMAGLFAGDGTSAADLVIYEVGPAVEASFIEVSKDGTHWTAVGKAPGGRFGIDLDAFGFGPNAALAFVRITDAGDPFVPPAQGDTTAGADIDAVSAVGHAPFFGGETALNNGAFYLQFAGGVPFGYYSYLADQNYIYHFDLGYEYVFDAADANDGVYLYDFKSKGYFYTSPTFKFPYLYDFALGSVVYYYRDPNNAGHYNTNGVRYFYVFNTGKIISK